MPTSTPTSFTQPEVSSALLAPGAFASRLIAWQARAGRHDLPWQHSRDPYRIWLSEIMLQQTQVETVKGYYLRFVEHFPDVASLAAAPLDAVLGLWSGLGYYARARNLHAAAQRVISEHGGRFPRDSTTLLQLPGIGRSTAAAIAAFAAGERSAILDGNVKRVLCRAFGIEGFPGARDLENRLWALAGQLLPTHAADMPTYTQAQMDLGATVCTRSRPRCAECPLADACVARVSGRQHLLPQPRPKKTVPQRESRVLVLLAEGQVWLQQRPPQGIWGGLLAFPELADELDDERAIADWLRITHGVAARPGMALAPLRHAFTHFVLNLQPQLWQADKRPVHAAEPGSVWLTLDERQHAPLPTPVRTLLDRIAEPDLFSDAADHADANTAG